MTTSRWRLFDAGPQDAGTAIGRMPALAHAVASGDWDGILLTSVWGRAHFNVGWFEDVDAVLDLEAAAREGIDVVRRPVIGGGTAFYDEGCAATAAFFVPRRDDETLDEVLGRYQDVMRSALTGLGLADVAFEGSSDLRWHGRKLGALIAQNVLDARVAGCFVNLKRPDMDRYLRVAHVPEEKFRDKVVKDMVEYVATPADVCGTDLTYERFRDAIVAAFGRTGVHLDRLAATPDEDAAIASFSDLVSAPDWVRRVSSSRFADAAPEGALIGFANHKGRKLVRAGVAVSADGRIASAMLAGDMHLSPPEVLDDLAAALRGRAADRESLGAVVASALSAPGVEQADDHLGITAEDLTTALERAVREARGGADGSA